jgi:hypothetical protein
MPVLSFLEIIINYDLMHVIKVSISLNQCYSLQDINRNTGQTSKKKKKERERSLTISTAPLATSSGHLYCVEAIIQNVISSPLRPTKNSKCL